MTQAEALQEAQRRWGEKAFAHDYPRTTTWARLLGQRICRVGIAQESGGVKGVGESYRGAFADADSREQAKP